ncbi:GNAT family N-acetyltransferase [Pseudomonas typographi]|uniref:GNAT family N-acetyltransferase n=1 Tax=Pseudomonas typographi TaxID=2715964 RepID=UPI001685BB24|nr:GNAT family N-acetyltransferase [Pseudomonas typographi]MBD1552658.1 GNAT family N-acetyltransferase [Pseudomonas typographi]MBD1588139.1 GNAT family N-acetyltransferase [Pseudomonas typographi]
MAFSLIRTARADDGEAVYQLYQHPGSALAYLADAPLGQGLDAAGLIGATLGRYPFLVAQRNEQLVGFAYARAHRAAAGFRWSVDVAVHAAPGEHQAAVATALYRQLAEQLSEQGYLALYVTLPLAGEGHIALHERLGFAHIDLAAEIDLQGACGSWCLTLDALPARQEPVPYGQWLMRRAAPGLAH